MAEFNPGTAADLNEAVKLRYEANADTNAFSDAEKAKLAGVANGATQNATDASLRDRATHTGQQPIGSVTGLQTALDGKAALATAQNFTAAQSVAPVMLTDAATIATNASLSNQFYVTLGGNRILGAPTNLVAGRVYEWEIIQDGAGSRALAFASIFKFEGGVAPTLGTAPGSRDLITCRYNGTSLHCIKAGSFSS